MKTHFWIFGSEERGQKFCQAAEIPELGLQCQRGSLFKGGDFSQTPEAAEVKATLEEHQDEICLVVIHPSIPLVKDIFSWQQLLRNPRLVLALCSLAPSKLSQFLEDQGAPSPAGLVLIPTPLPDEPQAQDLDEFKADVRVLGEICRAAEEATQHESAGVLTERIERLPQDFAEARGVVLRCQLVKVMAEEVREIASEAAAREHACNVAFAGREEMLAAVKHYDNRSPCTWAKQVADFNHAVLKHRFRLTSATPDPVELLQDWKGAYAELLKLLRSAWPFSVLNFTRAVRGETVPPDVPPDVTEVIEYLEEMNGKLHEPGVDVIHVFRTGAPPLTQTLGDLTKKWYEQ